MTKTTRRDLLRLGLGSSTLLACGSTVPTFLAHAATALADDTGKSPDGRILVVIQLDGGNDGLNTVVPHGDDIYHQSRPKLAFRGADLKPIDDHVGLHPALTGFDKLRDTGRLAIVQSVGYPNPNRSHFESMAIWHTARLDPGRADPGWLARALDSASAAPGGDAPALHVATAALPQALQGGRQFIPSLSRADQFHLRNPSTQRTAPDSSGDPANPLLAFVARSTVASYASSARLEAVLQEDQTATRYPESYALARRLKPIARLIRSGVTTPIFYAQHGSFDTHVEQPNQHANLLRELGDSAQAFLADLDAAGLGDRVAVLVFSEFGRRLHENANAGTDHGTAGPVFLLGRPVQGGLLGPYPDLAHLQDGDPTHAIDFRQVYATVLDQWLHLPAATVLGQPYLNLPLFRG